MMSFIPAPSFFTAWVGPTANSQPSGDWDMAENALLDRAQSRSHNNC